MAPKNKRNPKLEQACGWEFFINNRRFTVILAVSLILIGLASFMGLRKESDPEVDFAIGVVTTIYPGASARDVEELVTDVIEKKLTNLEEVAEIKSTSYQGVSSIIVEFDVDAKSYIKIPELKDEVDKAKPDLPDDAEDPVVEKISFENTPFFRMSLKGPYSVSYLKNIGEEIKDEIEKIGGISEVNIIGGEEREMQVIVDKASLDKFSLSLSEVTNAIKEANSDIPIGSIETADEKYTVKFEGRLKTVKDIRNIPIKAISASPIFVYDVAEVIDSFEDVTSISRLSIDGSEPESAVSLNILKNGGTDVLKITDKINLVLEDFKENSLPENIQIAIIEDQSELIRKDLKNLGTNALETIIIIAVLLTIFIGWREAFLACISIPLTFFITFIFLNYFGYTLNFITLFSLILSLGILVDSSIVIVEGMVEQIAKGRDPKEAAILTVREYRGPLISGTFTTVFAFLPMILTSGIIGKYIRSIPITITIVLTASIFVALGVLTSLSARWMQSENKKNLEVHEKGFIKKLILYYESFLRNLFNNKKTRRKFVISVLASFIFAMSLPYLGILKVNMFPGGDSDYFFVNIQESFGTPIELTSRKTERVEDLFLNDSRIESLQINIGSLADPNRMGGMLDGEHLANIVVNLKDEGKERKEKSSEIIKEYQDIIAENDFGVTDVKIEKLNDGPPGGAPITISLFGPSLETLDKLSREMAVIIENIPGTTNVDTSVEETNGEFVIEIDRAKAEIYGVSATQIALILRNAINGTDATVIRDAGDDTDVLVKYALDYNTKTHQADLDTIEALTIATPKGDIPLNTFTTSRLSNSRAFIEHEDQKRVVKITGNVLGNKTVAEVLAEFNDRVSEIAIPDEYSFSFGGEQEDINKSFTDLLKALLLGVFVIAMILVLQFNSYRQPLFILITIPLSFIAIFPGLVLMGQPLSFPGVIGVVALAGIVINDAIILIDKINNNRRRGEKFEEAIISAGKARLQPIILTTLTTVSGIFPLVFADPTWAPIAFSIIFGLSFATILTLVVIPLLYRRFGEKELDTMF